MANALSLYELCTPRKTVFDDQVPNDALDLSDLAAHRIDPDQFFKETFVTEGMKSLLTTASARFSGKSSVGIIRLTQSMGGGKTHNMITLGMLARYPKLRQKYFPDLFKDDLADEVTVLSFTGRENAEYGIWGELAKQLDRTELIKHTLQPLHAPGKSDWEKLLRQERPLLILLDELPPYLEGAQAVPVGATTLADITVTALANLCIALAGTQLPNVLLVMADLPSAYARGHDKVNEAMSKIRAELTRVALNITPVNQASNELYDILRTRLFERLADKALIQQVAAAYGTAVKDAAAIGLTNMAPYEIQTRVAETYPFHPAIKDLVGRFQENQGFQQTRGVLRLMRAVLRRLWEQQKTHAGQILIHPYDIDLGDARTAGIVDEIKPTLKAATAHDVYGNGNSAAEKLSVSLKVPALMDLARLLLFSSLSSVANGVLGLRQDELFGFLARPGIEYGDVRNALDQYEQTAWYVHRNARDGSIYIDENENLARLRQRYAEGIGTQEAEKEVDRRLSQLFEPQIRTCYQELSLFPTSEQFQAQRTKRVLAICIDDQPLAAESTVQHMFAGSTFPNQAAFLVGSKGKFADLLQKVKYARADRNVLDKLDQDGVRHSQNEYQQADQWQDRDTMAVLAAIGELFDTLYYPAPKATGDTTQRSLGSTTLKFDWKVEDLDGKRKLATDAAERVRQRGEDQVMEALKQENKFYPEIRPEDALLRERCEERLFTQKRMQWKDVVERAASSTSWPWYVPMALEQLKQVCLKQGVWHVDDDMVERGPFDALATVVVKELRPRAANNPSSWLSFEPSNGDTVQVSTSADMSDPVTLSAKQLTGYQTEEPRLFIRCLDSRGTCEPGDPKEWLADIVTVPSITDHKLTFEGPTAGLDIWYTIDGSDPQYGGKTYAGTAVNIGSDVRTVQYLIRVGKDVVHTGALPVQHDAPIDPVKPGVLPITREILSLPTGRAAVVTFLQNLAAAHASLAGISLHAEVDPQHYIDMQCGHDTSIAAAALLDRLQNLTELLEQDPVAPGKINDGSATLKARVIRFATGRDAQDWATKAGIDQGALAGHLQQGTKEAK
jgi:hypothetical protein